jgi:hypothetical protein
LIVWEFYSSKREAFEHDLKDYYRVRQLVPKSLKDRFTNLNARLVITNYHSFLPKTLRGNKKSPFDGKVDLDGNKIKRPDSVEDYSIVVRRILGNFKTGSRLLILNDEAHPVSTYRQKAMVNTAIVIFISICRKVCRNDPSIDRPRSGTEYLKNHLYVGSELRIAGRWRKL